MRIIFSLIATFCFAILATALMSEADNSRGSPALSGNLNRSPKTILFLNKPFTIPAIVKKSKPTAPGVNNPFYNTTNNIRPPIDGVAQHLVYKINGNDASKSAMNGIGAQQPRAVYIGDQEFLLKVVYTSA